MTIERRPTPPVVLTIAGTDSGGGAGAAADLRTFAAHGVHGTLAVTVVTAQDSVAVRRLAALEPELVAAQIDAVVADLHPSATKTGMLARAEVVEVVIERAGGGALGRLVVDPVLVSSRDEILFGAEVVEAYRLLVAEAAVFTPNLTEASLFLERSVTTPDEMEEAARDLFPLGAELVVVKGGRLKGSEAVDVAYDGRSIVRLEGPFLESRNVHGSGCTLSAAVAANLAQGMEALPAVMAAKRYVGRALALASRWELGEGHGPLDQLGAGRLPIASLEEP